MAEIHIGNAAYLESAYEAYLQNPLSVEETLRQYFSELFFSSPKESPSSQPLSLSSVSSPSKDKNTVRDSLRALMMIRNYRVRGHLHADLDPLKLQEREEHTELSPAFYGFTKEDYDRPLYLDGVLGFDFATIPQILDRLTKTYCGTIGVEFMHIQDPDQKSWIQESFEAETFSLSPDDQKTILTHLLKAELLERFLHTKFQGAKRFGLDGGESLIPALEFSLGWLVSQGIEHAVIGMAHRGRLNVLTNIIGKDYRKLFAKFLSDKHDPYATGSGDVKYHLGYSHERMIQDKRLHLSLASNPSHLEAVNPVVLGKVRAEQLTLKDEARKKVMGILMHGDAAFAGQGLVAETLELSGLSGYCTGGTLHIIINNQIGFTTSPPHSRSSPYSSDIAKAIQAPVFHVNGDDPEAVLKVFYIALSYRAHFQQDVVVDLTCYRRYGHNESDEPSFTQPLMYKAIASHPSISTVYSDKLLKERILSSEEFEKMKSSTQEVLDKEYQKATTGDDCYEHPHWLKAKWQDIEAGPTNDLSMNEEPQTGIHITELRTLGEALFKDPPIQVHSKILRQLKNKQKMMSSGEGIDWATAEALAFASLIKEGHHVRLSGQDCGRGTFSQRHAVLVDQESEEKYIPLNHLGAHLPSFDVIDSPLAEASVLGFEYGYAGANPNNLVLWEAQFGDFANGAQVITDQFIAAGEMKWSRQNGLVMLLPHGFEGQGPEHSSARLERFLQLCGNGNWIVANCSTPASYFHILRRQLKQKYRKPLILMTPKSLLRHKLCVSTLEAFGQNTAFRPVIPFEKPHDAQSIEKVVLCSGKIYYDLLQSLEAEKASHVALIRLEQFYPFPHAELIKTLSPYKNALFLWCQEEPENMGGWQFLDRRLEQVLLDIQARHTRPCPLSRPTAASPATGILKRHEEEQSLLMKVALERSQNFRQPLIALN